MKNIDDKLKNFSETINGSFKINRPDSPKAVINFEERRIDWLEDNIHKAIIIQPTFELNGVNSELWNFINFAWINDLTSHPRPQWKQYLAEQEPFYIIERNIDSFLKKSKEDLGNIKYSDLIKST